MLCYIGKQVTPLLLFFSISLIGLKHFSLFFWCWKWAFHIPHPNKYWNFNYIAFFLLWNHVIESMENFYKELLSRTLWIFQTSQTGRQFCCNKYNVKVFEFVLITNTGMHIWEAFFLFSTRKQSKDENMHETRIALHLCVLYAGFLGKISF